MNGPKVVKTGSLNLADVIGLAAFLGLFLALLGPRIRVIRVVSPLPWPAVAAYSAEAAAKAGSAKEATLSTTYRRAANFPRNLVSVSVLYSCERPEMNFS